MANNSNSQAAENAAMEEMKKKLAEAEAKLAELAEQQEKNAVTAAKSDKVKIKIPLERNSSNEDVQVFINGRQYIIRRGVEVEVPRGVAEILANREKMLEVIDAFNKKNAQ